MLGRGCSYVTPPPRSAGKLYVSTHVQLLIVDNVGYVAGVGDDITPAKLPRVASSRALAMFG